MKLRIIIFMCLIGVGSGELLAQQLVYKPMNPMFGGDTFNYQFLLQSAQAQNSFKDPDQQGIRSGFNDRSDLERFTESLNRQLLNQISRTLFTQQFGADGNLTPGTFSFGSLVIEIFESTEGLVIDILDTSNGDLTQVIIPGN